MDLESLQELYNWDPKYGDFLLNLENNKRRKKHRRRVLKYSLFIFFIFNILFYFLFIK
jgi:cytoskeletal protein RodZ